MKSSTVLRLARHKIRTPDRWCRGALARAGSGRPLTSESANAVSFCAAGALFSVVGYFYTGEIIPVFNDAPTTTHADILRLYDKAIELAEAAGD